MKRILALALLAGSLSAAPVLTTERGKTYHARKCLALSRAKQVYTVSDADAKAHGLKPCGICYRPAKAPKSDKSAWMKGGK
jgi:hypothetical protein